MKFLFCLASWLAGHYVMAQNVGIGNSTPTEKLDVNGNINLTGTIKANGTDGLPNQVLMKNGNGTLSWGDLCDFKNMATFRTASGNWNIPAGVTRFAVEVWGAGGGGNWYAAGGGGGYARALFTVNPGVTSASYSVGNGGNFGSGGLAGSGDPSSVTYDAVVITANGGGGANFSSITATPGAGGTFSVSAGFTAYTGMIGSPGGVLENSATQSSSTAYYELCRGGHGGDAGQGPATGGKGAFALINSAGAAVRVAQKTNGLQPGGGGGSGYIVQMITSPSVTNGASGGNGMVIFRY